MGGYKPVKGDRVRVVLEGEADHVDDDGFALGRSVDSNFIVAGADHVVSIEKIEPPVTVFKPGDVVLAKGGGDEKVLLGRTGYLYVAGHAGYWGDFVPYDEGRDASEFNSKNYEKVSLGR